MDQTITTSRSSDLRLALRLTYATLAWMVIEGAASLLLGAKSHSLLLESFGLDSVLELVSAAVLLWRLQTEARGTSPTPSSRGEKSGQPLLQRGVEVEDATEAVERKASRIVGRLLYVLAAYVAAMSVYGLAVHQVTDTRESVWGILIGVVAKIGMPLLASAKLKVAARLGSRALRADAMEAVTCGYLSIVLIIGLAVTRIFGWWWLDSAASLALIPFLIKEGREAVTGQCTCGHECS